MIRVGAILLIMLELVCGQGTPKRYQIASMTAKIGNDGTDDAVSVKICSDVNIADCCSATLDKGVRKDEWVKSKIENWEAREFKACKNKPFQIRNGPILSVTKNGVDNLKVNSIDFYMKTANQDQTRFKCEGFEFLNGCTTKPNGLCTYSFRQCQNCKLTKCDGKPAGKQPGKLPSLRPGPGPNRPIPTVPAKDKKIDQMTVYVGPEGTDDNVKMKICSTDLTKCCVSDTLSHLLKSEWVKEKQEKWEAGKFGKKCKNEIFKVTTHPRLFLIKTGKDNLSVRKLDFTMKNPLNDKEKTSYSCKGFDVVGDCSKKPNKQCEQDLGACLQKVSGSPPASPQRPRTPPRPSSNRPNVRTKDQKIDKMVVNMGPDGTDDDVKVKICSDDNSVCCESGKLSHLLKSEWVKNKQETWEAKKFGDCKKQVFKISSRPKLSIIKNGKDSLTVNSLDLVMKNPLKEAEKTTYSCRGFSITDDCTKQPNKVCVKSLGQCLAQGVTPTSRPTLKPNPRVPTRPPKIPSKDQKIDKMVVNMGPDGTRDDVKIKICSDGNAVCCTSGKLSHLLSREWVENKQETWEAGKFGDCKKKVFKITSQPRLFVIKNGKDSMSVKSLNLVMKDNLNDKEKTTYSCNGFSIIEDCSTKKNKECIKDLGTCLRSKGNNVNNPSNRSPIIATTPPPLKEVKFEKMIVNMGTDGTRDDVHVKLCSQDGSTCCDSGELSHLLSREWVENKQETWDAGDFGKCKKQVFKVSTFPRVTIFKNGKDDMSVNSIDLIMNNSKNAKEKTTFRCSGFSIKGDCGTKTNKECSKDLICFKK